VKFPPFSFLGNKLVKPVYKGYSRVPKNVIAARLVQEEALVNLIAARLVQEEALVNWLFSYYALLHSPFITA
jgi:hypothetical protein